MVRSRAASRWFPILLATSLLGSAVPAAATGDTASPTRHGAARQDPGRPRAIVDPYRSEGRQPVAPGVAHDWGAFLTDSSTGRQVAHIVEVDPDDPALAFEASLSNDTATDLERLSLQAARQSGEGHRVIGAINGDTWSGYDHVRLSPPKGLHVQDGELMAAGDLARPTFGVTADRRPMIGSVRLTAAVTVTAGAASGSSLAVRRVNQHRRLNDLVLYTSRFGGSTLTDATGTEVVLGGVTLPLTPTGEHAAAVLEVRTASGDTPIGPGQLVLSGVGSARTFLDGLTAGDTLTLALTVTPGWEEVREAVGGRETLVRDGVVAEAQGDTWTEVHPRSAIGITAEGRIVMAAVDGRQPGYSTGARLDELADFMLARGALQAINLDGGGSTGLLVRRPGDVEVSFANRGSESQERRISNGLLLVTSMPTGPATTVLLSPPSAELYSGQTVDFEARAHDAGWNGIATSPDTLRWSMEGTGGTLAADGRFTATVDGSATVIARVGDAAGSAPVTVIHDTTAPITQPPKLRFKLGSTVSEATVPVALDWPPATGSQSPVVRYELLMSANYGGYVAIPLPGSLARSVTLELAQQQSHRFVLRAVNAAGNVGAWARTGPLVAGVLHDGDPAIAADVSWSSQAAPQFLRGVTQRSKVGGSVLSVTVTGERVAWLGAKGPNRGSAEVLVDGTLVTTVDTAAAAVQPRQVLFQRRFDVPGTHTLEIRHLDDPVGSRVDVDGFLVVRAGGPDPVLVGAGDIASCDRTTDSATATLLDGVVGTVITTGDLAYDRGTAAEFAACYAPTWGRVKSRTRPTPGNHEYYTTAAAGYFGYFGSAAGAPDKGWYAYDLGTWRIYALNSNCAAVGGCDEGSPQLAWLRADLAARPRACVAAYWHHPRFSSGPHGNNMDVGPLFAELHAAGADVVMTGHDHDYERFALQSPSGEADASTGVRQFVVGTGGNGLYPWGTFKPNSEVRQNTNFGVLELTMRSGAYDWRFLPVAGGMFTDSGTATCH